MPITKHETALESMTNGIKPNSEEARWLFEDRRYAVARKGMARGG